MKPSKPHNLRASALPLGLFLGLTFLLSAIFDFPIFGKAPLAFGPKLYMAAVMWCPGVAALLTSAAFRSGLKPYGLARFRFTWMGLGVVLPVILVTAQVALCALGGGCRLDFSRWHGMTGLAVVPIGLGILRALGEELGFRGFLLPKLREGASFNTACLVSGLIFGLWHYPEIIQGGYLDGAGVPLLAALLCFTVMAVGFSFMLSWLWAHAESVWPCALGHWSFNFFTQRVLARVIVATPHTKLWLGEMSYGAAMLGVLMVVCFRERS